MGRFNAHIRPVSAQMDLPASAQFATNCDNPTGNQSSLEIKLCFLNNMFDLIVNAQRSIPFFK